jgi:hypothetical protein
LGLIGVMLFSRFGAAMAGPTWWYALRPLELAGAAPKGALWWLGLVGWMVIGLAGLVLMGRGANRSRRPHLVSTLVLMALVCVSTWAMGRALYVRPGKVLRLASLSRLHQLTGIELPRGTQLVAGRVKAGPVMVLRAQLTMPAAAVAQFVTADSGVWPGDASSQAVDRETVLATLQETETNWGLADWRPERIPDGAFGVVVFGDSAATWQATFLSDAPPFGEARVFLDCRQ